MIIKLEPQHCRQWGELMLHLWSQSVTGYVHLLGLGPAHRLAAVLPVHTWTTGSLGCPKSTDSSSLWEPRFCACQSNQPKLCLSTFPKRDHWCFTPSHSSWLPSGTTYWSLSWQRTRKPLSFQWLRRNLLVFHGSVFFFLVSNMYILCIGILPWIFSHSNEAAPIYFLHCCRLADFACRSCCSRPHACPS